jgi:hypothetical protein
VALPFYSFLFLFILVTRTRCSLGPPRGYGGLLLLFHFICFVFISFHFILVYVHNTHQVLVGLLRGVGGLAIILFYFEYFI